MGPPSVALRSAKLLLFVMLLVHMPRRGNEFGAKLDP
jgi:hypothetical protein